MKSTIPFAVLVLALASAAFTFGDRETSPVTVPLAVDDEVAPAEARLTPWRRPPGPPRVALQAGHWLASEAPDEQAGLRNNGTRGGGKQEWEVNLAIAERSAELLRQRGYIVEVLPTTIPPSYWADVFVSIHADGNPSPGVSGFRAAAPGRDATGRAEALATLLERSYGESTGLPRYPTVTRRMRYYYAFNWRRYRHSLHPMTTAAIIETGFLTSPRDRTVIVGEPDRAARGIAEAVYLYLETVGIEPEIAVPQPALPQRRINPLEF